MIGTSLGLILNIFLCDTKYNGATHNVIYCTASQVWKIPYPPQGIGGITGLLSTSSEFLAGKGIGARSGMWQNCCYTYRPQGWQRHHREKRKKRWHWGWEGGGKQRQQGRICRTERLSHIQGNRVQMCGVASKSWKNADNMGKKTTVTNSAILGHGHWSLMEVRGGWGGEASGKRRRGQGSIYVGLE